MSTANILGVGALSPLGFDARQTAFGMRSRKLVPRPCAFRDARDRQIGSARAFGIADDVVGAERMVLMGARALREAAADAGVARDQPIRVFVGFPERSRPLPPEDERLLAASSFLPQLEKHSRCRIDGAGSEVLRLGHAGFAVALERAIAALGSGGPIAVGGIDTYHHPDLVAWLDKELRLLGDVVHNGFIPSEGAAFVVIGNAKADRPPIARVAHVTAGVEQLPPDEPRTGALMTELVRNAGVALGAGVVPWVLTDLNGERHRTKEWSFVSIRNNDLLVDDDTVEEHVGQLIGDAGAATGALAGVFAAVGFRTGFAPASEALIALHSDGDERGVAVLEAAT